MPICYNCGSTSLHIENIKRKYIFKGEIYWIPVQIEKCDNCEDITIIDSEKNIIKKIYKAYSAEHNLPTADDLKKFMSITNMSSSVIDHKYNLSKGTTTAILKGMSLITNKYLISDISKELGKD